MAPISLWTRSKLGTRSGARVLFASGGAFLGTSVPVLAQLEEVVVTAQKREQSLQDVAVAVSAFSADMMENAGVVNMDDITALTPGFAISTYNPPLYQGGGYQFQQPGGRRVGWCVRG